MFCLTEVSIALCWAKVKGGLPYLALAVEEVFVLGKLVIGPSHDITSLVGVNYLGGRFEWGFTLTAYEHSKDENGNS